MSRYFTNSELGTKRRCWRKWYFQHYLKIFRKRETINEATYTGILVHSGVADMYNSGTDPLAVIVHQAATDIAEQERNLQDATSMEQATIEQNIETIKKAEEFALIIVEGYVEWLAEEGADEYLTFISAETELAVKMPSDTVQSLSTEVVFLLGKLDTRFMDERSGARVFMDHKTVQNFADREKWAQLDPQFLFYSLIEYLDLLNSFAESKAIPSWTDGGIINMLRKVKRTARSNPPFYKRKEIRHSIVELRNFFARTSGEISAVLAAEKSLDEGIDHRLVCPPTPTRDCSWDCPYMQLCTIVDDGSDAEGFIQSAFVIGDPLQRYDTVTG